MPANVQRVGDAMPGTDLLHAATRFSDLAASTLQDCDASWLRAIQCAYLVNSGADSDVRCAIAGDGQHAFKPAQRD
eukprot:3941792-Rhodomonas_salina.1